ncbi:MAG TPA: hypothetical protein VJ802_05600 [Gemmatimonadaceae bacterium]|nr:hypothetical protein [Gemmatimonadaceae bacterium]
MTAREGPTRLVRSFEDDALEARIVRRRPMRYAAGADPAHDRPEHVRAASGLAWVGNRLAVIQDDASFIALVDAETGLADAFPLPAGPGGARQFDDARGNKAGKLDLEALTIIPGSDGVLLAAFGSGSLAPRETVVLVSFAGNGNPSIDVRPASEFYALMRRSSDFAGSEMNVEGALYMHETLRLFGRGNGAVRGELRPVNASCDVSWPALRGYLEHPMSVAPPAPASISQYDLGALDGVPLGFTDVALGRGSAVLYAAAAEASPDATRDGEVRGSVVGAIEARAGVGRWARLREENGAPFMGKVEGLTMTARRADRAFAVIDSDDHSTASDLLEVRLAGPWWKAG